MRILKKRPLCWATIPASVDELPQKCLNCKYKLSCIKKRIKVLKRKHFSLENPSIRLGKIFESRRRKNEY